MRLEIFPACLSGMQRQEFPRHAAAGMRMPAIITFSNISLPCGRSIRAFWQFSQYRYPPASIVEYRYPMSRHSVASFPPLLPAPIP